MKVSVLGIDLGKNVCSIVGLDAAGAVVLRRSVKRETLIGLAAKLPRCIVAMEACCGAHHIGRLFMNQGHDVRLMSPEYVRPYVKAPRRLIGLSLILALRFNGVEHLRLLFDGVGLLLQFLTKSLHLGLVLHRIYNFSQGGFHFGFEFKIDGF